MSRPDQDVNVVVTSGSEGRWFGQTPAVFLLHSGAQPAARCVMTALCLYSDAASGRTEYLSQTAIANAAGVSRETTTRCIAWLEDEGWIEVYDDRPRGENGRFPTRVYSVAPAWRRERERFAAEHAMPVAPRRRRKATSDDRSPVTSDVRSHGEVADQCREITGPVTSDHRSSDERSQITERTENRGAAAAAAASTTEPMDEAQGKVTVEQVVDTFNQLTGGSWTAPALRRRIQDVIDVHPDLTLADHRRIIQRQLDEPWWTGPARPNHVYRDLEQFERCIADAAAMPATAPAAGPDDGLTRAERDAIEAYRNTGVDAHLGEIDAVGSPAARAAAAAARAGRQVVAA